MSKGKWNGDYYQEVILNKMAKELNTVGHVIRTGDVWRAVNEMPYSSVIKHTRLIMETMVEQGKAKRIKNGQWEILKPNERKR